MTTGERADILRFWLFGSRTGQTQTVFRITGGIGMLARVAGLRILDEKPSGSCTYPGCTCMPRRAEPRHELARCFKHLSRGIFLTSRCQRTRAIHPEYISRCEQERFFRRIHSRLNVDVRHHSQTSLLNGRKCIATEIFLFYINAF